MHYVMGDIHGCCDEYLRLIDRLKLKDDDELFVTGNAMDIGPEPIRVMQDLMNRHNIIYIVGNHDLMMLKSLRPLDGEITLEAIQRQAQSGKNDELAEWMKNGGIRTLTRFLELDRHEQEDMLCYIEESSVYEETEVGGKTFVIVHAGIRGFDGERELGDYDMDDFLWESADYGRRYFPDEDTYLVTGHTPTTSIREDGQPLVYRGKGHIAVDCGCVFGGRLAAVCLETGEEYYEDSDGKQ